MNLKVVLFVFTVIFYRSYVDATICKPLSTFKVDCDECQCSNDGTEYSCTIRDCRSPSFNEYNDDDGVYTMLRRNAKLAVPYLNDEIPPSREKFDNEFEDDLNYDEVKGNDKEDNGFQDVSLGEQDASVIENDLPDDYRLRRFLKPGK